MTTSALIDTFPRFLSFWENAQSDSLETQVERWASEYLAPWPELLEKQKRSYLDDGVDWRRVATKRVFPYLADRLPAMEVAHGSILATHQHVATRIGSALGFQTEVTTVIYVGIGCGAGWATRYAGSPAVLLGLETIAECGWTNTETITGLIAHEYGHLTHSHMRAEAGVATGSGPWWQLYREGYAQAFEHMVAGKESWHMRGETGADDWLDWCQKNRAWLAREFLRIVDAGQSVRPFFGSWYQIEGRSQTGYYLGCELVGALLATTSFREIALLQPDDPILREALEHLATE